MCGFLYVVEKSKKMCISMCACNKERTIVLKILRLCGFRKLYGVVWETGAWKQRWVKNKAGYLCFVVRREPYAWVRNKVVGFMCVLYREGRK